MITVVNFCSFGLEKLLILQAIEWAKFRDWTHLLISLFVCESKFCFFIFLEKLMLEICVIKIFNQILTYIDSSGSSRHYFASLSTVDVYLFSTQSAERVCSNLKIGMITVIETSRTKFRQCDKRYFITTIICKIQVHDKTHLKLKYLISKLTHCSVRFITQLGSSL